MTLLTDPGLYRIPPSAYHADPSAVPSLSSGVAKLLVDATPYHAMWAHPRLNPNYDPSTNIEIGKRTAFGSAAHEMLLGIHEGDRSLIKFIDAPDYRTKAAQQARDEALRDGKFPMLRHELAEAEAVVEAVKRQIDITMLYPGESEICALAEVDGVWCRALCDWLVVDGRTVIDAKFTAKQMNPTAFVKHAIGMGYDLSSGFYRSVLAKLEGVDPAKIDYVFLVIERGPPVVASLVRLPIQNADVGLEKARYARRIWGECMKSKKWPAYGDGVLEGDPANWAVYEWETRVQDEKLDLGFKVMAPYQDEEMVDA